MGLAAVKYKNIPSRQENIAKSFCGINSATSAILTIL
jgi:predicted nucleic acid binding AN1-type Zn finger protein